MKTLVLESNLGRWEGKECIDLIIEAFADLCPYTSWIITEIINDDTFKAWSPQEIEDLTELQDVTEYTIKRKDIIKIYGKSDPITGNIPGL